MDTEPTCSVWQCATPDDAVEWVVVTPVSPLGRGYHVRIPTCRGCRTRYSIPLATTA